MDGQKIEGCARMKSENRIQMTVRLNRADKELLDKACSADGLETGTAVRQILELICGQIRNGEEYVEVVVRLKAALRKAPVRTAS